ncbi:MAG: ABC transporter ATP-binding protein [Anaerolineae bacterium]|nr:ABC transporter ATP-binding protein [Anaerolineae bacterium]
MLIQINQLNKTYRTREGSDIHALKDITFSMDEGEFVTVVGPSGCGKSTLLKILAGILPKSGGNVLLRNQPVEGPRKDIGVVFQSPVLLPWQTVLENVMVPAKIQGLDMATYKERALHLLQMAGLKDFESKYPYELSGGMQQRVGISRALVCDPAILLMDEPFGALDAMTREHMNIELLRIWEESKKTVLFITHSITESVLLADRVIVLSPRPGQIARIIEIDLPRPRTVEMYSLPKFGQYTTEIRKLLNVKGAID